MARTWIDGGITSMVIIADAAYGSLVTTDSGYAWGFNTSKQTNVQPLKALSEIQTMNGTVKIIEGNFAAQAWAVSDAILDSNTKYRNFLSMIKAWKDAKTLLYFYIINEWGTGANYNLAITTALTQLTGFIRNIRMVPEPQNMLVSFEFHYSEAV